MLAIFPLFRHRFSQAIEVSWIGTCQTHFRDMYVDVRLFGVLVFNALSRLKSPVSRLVYGGDGTEVAIKNVVVGIVLGRRRGCWWR